MSFRKQPIAIVDIETTGSRTQNGRMIEVGVLRIEDGKLVSSFETLINPEQPIPYSITVLTGITDKDVEKSPTFKAISNQLQDILDGCLFIAHNASFDYGFVKYEFKRMGIDFNAQTLCSVKLSRKLFPEHAQHNLGILIERYKLVAQARHRALDDAKVVWEFLQIIEQDVLPEKINETWLQLTHQPVLPKHLNIKSFDDIPEESGVYTFYNKDDKPIYVGKASHLREKLMTYFEGLPEGKRAQMINQLHRIETQLTCGDLGSKLLQDHLIKTLKPTFNFPVRVDMRQPLKPLRWPFSSAVIIEEKDVLGERSQVFYVDQWVLKKAITVEGDDSTSFFKCDGKFDQGIAKMLYAYLKSHPTSAKSSNYNEVFKL